MLTTTKSDCWSSVTRTHVRRRCCLSKWGRLSLVGGIWLLLLTGCASNSLPVPRDCPPPVMPPAELLQSDLPAANDYSAKVSAWLKKVQDWLSEERSEKMD